MVYVLRYELRCEQEDESKREQIMEKINGDLLKKLMELDTDICFSTGNTTHYMLLKSITHLYIIPPHYGSYSSLANKQNVSHVLNKHAL